jgi:hypothetical protein
MLGWGNVAEIVGHGGAPEYASSNEDSSSSEAGLEEAGNAHASCDKSSCTYCFGASTITLGRIRKMAEKCYFAEGEACAAGEETTPKPMDDEVVIFEDFFIVGLRMPPHSVLVDILLKFHA